MSFRDRVVWITGASSGIGAALARALAAQGAKLVLSARRLEELEKVRQQCGGPDRPIVLLPMDVAALDMAPRRAEEAVAAFGQVDLLICCAGISQRALAKDTDLSVDRRIMRVNYFGTVAPVKALLPHFLERRAGRIVVVTSVTGKFGTPLRSAYAASKHALHGFFDSLRAELHGTGIGVTLLCPGFVRTEVSINALRGDGRETGVMDDAIARGMDPDVFAAKALAAIAAGRMEAYFGGREAFGVWLKRFFPGLFARMIARARVT